MQAGYAHHGRHGCQACALATHDWTHIPNEPALLNEPIARTTNAGASERAGTLRNVHFDHLPPPPRRVARASFRPTWHSRREVTPCVSLLRRLVTARGGLRAA